MSSRNLLCFFCCIENSLMHKHMHPTLHRMYCTYSYYCICSACLLLSTQLFSLKADGSMHVLRTLNEIVSRNAMAEVHSKRGYWMRVFFFKAIIRLVRPFGVFYGVISFFVSHIMKNALSTFIEIHLCGLFVGSLFFLSPEHAIAKCRLAHLSHSMHTTRNIY